MAEHPKDQTHDRPEISQQHQQEHSQLNQENMFGTAQQQRSLRHHEQKGYRRRQDVYKRQVFADIDREMAGELEAAVGGAAK